MAEKNNVSLSVSELEADFFLESIAQEMTALDRVATGLMKKKLPDAAKPIYDRIKKLDELRDRIIASKE